MSQFKTREWWSALAGESREEFNPQSICVANCDNENNGNKILVGSLSGFLRVYQPKPDGFSAVDVLLEKSLGEPILQVLCGTFVSRNNNVHIAVLHPKHLVVYRLDKKETTDNPELVAGGVAYTLAQAFQHTLRHTAFSMCQGMFGGKADQASCICVLSLDGVITVFESDVETYACHTSGFLLPGPIAYCKQLDAMVTATTARFVQCYRYDAIVKTASSDVASRGTQSSQRVTPYWSVDLGESILEISEVVIDNARKRSVPGSPRVVDGDESCIMVLGERSLFCLELDGTIRFAKKLDSPPSCFVPYGLSHVVGGDNEKKASMQVMTLLAFHARRSLAVLSNTRLSWATSLPAGAPIAIAVASFHHGDRGEHEQRGLIVTLEDGGRIACSYLGTEPLQGSNPMAIRSRIDDSLVGETARLLALIRSVEKKETPAADIEVKKTTTELRLETRIRLSSEVPPPELEAGFESDEAGGDGEEVGRSRPCAVLCLVMHAPGEGGVHDIAVTVRCTDPVLVDPPGIVINQVAAGASSELEFRFFVARFATVSDASAAIVASYTSSSGYPNSLVCDVKLPFGLFVRPAAPEKEAACKMTIISNRQCVNLADLFQDVARQEQNYAYNSIAFQLPCRSVVSVLTARNSDRYRVQSQSLAALWLVLEELSSRLEQHHRGAAAASTEPFRLSLRQDLPLREYFVLVDGHLARRRALRDCMESLERRAVEFRMLQKRLLMRIKQVTPTPLGYLDMLLGRSYDLINEICAEEECLRDDVKRAAVELSGGTRSMLVLLRFYLGLAPDDYRLLEAVLSPHVAEPTDPLGWEETTDVALLHMIRTHLPKSREESEVALDSSDMSMPKNTLPLKQRLALFITRVQQRNEKAAAGSGSLVAAEEPKVTASSSSKKPREGSRQHVSAAEGTEGVEASRGRARREGSRSHAPTEVTEGAEASRDRSGSEES